MHYLYLFSVITQTNGLSALENEGYKINYAGERGIPQQPIAGSAQFSSQLRMDYAYTNSEEAKPSPMGFAINQANTLIDPNRPFQPEVIKHTTVKYSQEKTSNELSVEAPRDFEVAQVLSAAEGNKEVLLRVLQSTQDGGYINIFTGIAKSVSFTGESSIIKCERFTEAFNKSGLTENFSRNCLNNLFGRRCGVMRFALGLARDELGNESNVYRFLYGINTTILDIRDSGYTVEIEHDDFRYTDEDYISGELLTDAAGVAISLDPLLNDTGIRRMILRKNGRILTLATALTGVSAGEPIFVSVGCDRLITTCSNKFNNVPRFNGYPFIPIKDIFTKGIF